VTRPSECAFPHDYHAALGKHSNFKATSLHRVDSERALLSLLLTLLFRNDPDLLVGHDIANFDLPTLLARLAAHKIENWSRLGRLRRSGLLQHQQVNYYLLIPYKRPSFLAVLSFLVFFLVQSYEKEIAITLFGLLLLG
jgi:DNA polymerase elongation subunit (family B)